MAEANDKKLYPQTAVDGSIIPTEILLSIASCAIAFSATPVDDVELPATGDLLIFYGDPDEDCWVRFATSVTAPATDGTFVTGLTLIPAGTVKVMDRNGAEEVSVVGGAAGELRIEVASAYKDTRKRGMIDRP